MVLLWFSYRYAFDSRTYVLYGNLMPTLCLSPLDKAVRGSMVPIYGSFLLSRHCVTVNLSTCRNGRVHGWCSACTMALELFGQPS
jgi:hypothetical protein